MLRAVRAKSIWLTFAGVLAGASLILATWEVAIAARGGGNYGGGVAFHGGGGVSAPGRRLPRQRCPLFCCAGIRTRLQLQDPRLSWRRGRQRRLLFACQGKHFTRRCPRKPRSLKPHDVRSRPRTILTSAPERSAHTGGLHNPMTRAAITASVAGAVWNHHLAASLAFPGTA